MLVGGSNFDCRLVFLRWVLLYPVTKMFVGESLLIKLGWGAWEMTAMLTGAWCVQAMTSFSLP